MKVLLIQPPIEDFYHTKIRTYPLQLVYLATRIKDICDVSVVDFRTNVKSKVMSEHPFYELDNYYMDGIHTPFSMFNKYYRFGAGSDEIRETISNSKPDVVAVSSLFTTYAEEAQEIAGIAKEVSREIITVIGGTHPTVFPELVLNSPDIDYIIRGEGETPLFRLINFLQKDREDRIDEIPGVCFKKSNDSMCISSINVEDNIDLIPDRRFFKAENYRIGRKNYTFFLTSRGCPLHCSFCGKPPVPYRRRNIASIEKEVEECINLNIQAIDFEDDMLTYDTKFFNHVLDTLIGKGVTLSAMNGIYAETLDKDTLNRMYDAGFRRLNFSLVDISSSVIRRQKRHLPANFLKLLPYLEYSPFLVEIHFIIGLPEQKPEDVIETLIFLMGKRLLPGPSIFYLAPGSPLFDKYLIKDWQKHLKSMRSSCMTEVNPLFSRDTIFTFMQLTRFINFVKHCLDKEPSLKKLSDLPALLSNDKEYTDRHIFNTLLLEKRLIHYDIRKRWFADEPQDKELISAFFMKADKAVIRGFKTMNSLIVDM
ncbi:MAG: cobalamin-dependent protein [Proteobacteria bacterium]|nr:cobalamin-dependent protein [Pseudomonadota bacterium]